MARPCRWEAESVVEVESVDAATADRVGTLVTAAAAGPRDDGEGPLRVESVYDPTGERLKVIVVGSLAATAHVLGLVDAVLGSAA